MDFDLIITSQFVFVEACDIIHDERALSFYFTIDSPIC